jgi:hypothetical protein
MKNNEVWKNSIQELNDKFLKNIELNHHEKSTDDFITSVDSFLNKTSVEEYMEFLNDDKYYYIYDKINNNQVLRQDYILLVYFLTKRFRATFHIKADINIKILQRVYSDLGISFPYDN